MSPLRHYLRAIFSRNLLSNFRRFVENTRRRRVAGRIHTLEPIPLPDIASASVVVHQLTSRDMWQPALWAIRSLLFHLDAALPVIIHHDGSLTEGQQRAIRRLFPGIRIFAPTDTDPIAARALATLPECELARRESLMVRKLIDPWLVAPERDAILIDSDVLFFAKPTDLLDWIAGPRAENLWNGDYAAVPSRAYSVDSDSVRRIFGVELIPRINCGLGAVAARSFALDIIEPFLGFERASRDPWLTEQSTYAYLSSRFGGRLLPPAYYVGGETDSSPARLISKHYVGRIRRALFDEGIPWVQRQFLERPAGRPSHVSQENRQHNRRQNTGGGLEA